MTTKQTITELAQHKAELLEEIAEVNAEIASRAGEDHPPAKAKNARAKSTKTEPANDPATVTDPAATVGTGATADDTAAANTAGTEAK